MTRDQAEMAAIKVVGWEFSEDARRQIATLEALGMLKLDAAPSVICNMTDEEISAEVRARAADFCRALNIAGKAALQIEVKFGSSEREDGGPNGPKLTNWRSHTTLSRIHR